MLNVKTTERNQGNNIYHHCIKDNKISVMNYSHASKIINSNNFKTQKKETEDQDDVEMFMDWQKQFSQISHPTKSN